ncbi:MerR family transcriptional regulator [Porphyromonas gulae]|uniref:helix-turn-helix domain-containing protein n=1 Tax=Porphyromonas gulae TaxID=111105 RepID=UPI00052BDEAE|nr:helix-turn-helix domain-containing protein [Porphyromonas gulae]KGN68677.1 MerR family transcriptional regulator [Porphyromonas gulae]
MAGSKIPIKKICEYCNSEFYAHKGSTRFCSHTSNSRAYKQMKREAKTRAIETAEQAKKVKDIIDRPYLKISEAGRLLGVSRQTIYEHVYAGRLRASKITSRLSVVRREDIERMLAERPYEKRQPRDAILITELYTTDEVCDIHNISRSSLFAIAKRENIPRTYNRGKTYWSKRHIDAYFAKQAPASHIEEWCTAVEIQERFDMTLTAVYNFVSDHNIPRKKVKGKSYYSTKHVEAAKGVLDEAAPSYYTVREAMEKFGLTRDQLYHYTKHYNISKVKQGRNILIFQQELDEVLKPPSITR